MTNNNLIFDIGFHKGEDTRYYLDRGFHVVAVDAAEDIIKTGQATFRQEIAEGRLILRQAVVSAVDNELISFYISPNSQWNSAHKEIAERKGRHARHVQLPAVTLRTLMEEYGVPYYCKIDIEGNDIVALKSLKGRKNIPRYVSVETECIGDDANNFSDFTFSTLEALRELGYTKFKLVDQATLAVLGEEPFYSENDALRRYMNNVLYARQLLHKDEGCFSQYYPGSSGPFGRDLGGNWCDYAAAKELIAFHSKAQRDLGHEIWSFWCDWHATY